MKHVIATIAILLAACNAPAPEPVVIDVGAPEAPGQACPVCQASWAATGYRVPLEPQDRDLAVESVSIYVMASSHMSKAIWVDVLAMRPGDDLHGDHAVLGTGSATVATARDAAIDIPVEATVPAGMVPVIQVTTENARGQLVVLHCTPLATTTASPTAAWDPTECSETDGWRPCSATPTVTVAGSLVN